MTWNMSMRSGRSKGCCSSGKAGKSEAGACWLSKVKRDVGKGIEVGMGQGCWKRMRGMKNMVEIRAPRVYVTTGLFTVTTGKAPLMDRRSSLDGMERRVLHRLRPFRRQANRSLTETKSAVCIWSLESLKTYIQEGGSIRLIAK